MYRISPARPCAAEAAHAVADIQEKRLTLLLAVVAYVETGRDLLAHRVQGRVPSHALQRGCIHVFACCPAHVQRGERGRSREAAGMGCQDAVLAA
jgi:hypothetical protein